jgi:hypothetical protein
MEYVGEFFQNCVKKWKAGVRKKVLRPFFRTNNILLGRYLKQKTLFFASNTSLNIIWVG